VEQVADIDDEVMEKFLEGGATGVDVVSAQLLLHAIRRYAYAYATHTPRICRGGGSQCPTLSHGTRFIRP
jgi:hypothetical protein